MVPDPSALGEPHAADASRTRPLKVVLPCLNHDHAWWTARHVLEEPGLALVGVADPSPELRARAATEFGPGVEIASEAPQLLDRLRPDIAIVTAPNSRHLELVDASAALGVHCLIQKPMASTLADARAISSIATASGIRLMVNYYPMWSPQYQALFQLWGQGAVGEAERLLIANGHQGPGDLGLLSENYKDWLYDPAQHGGGALMDQATYGVAYAIVLMGRPLTVQASVRSLRPDRNRGVDDDSWLLMEHEHGTSVVQGSWALPFGGIGEFSLTGKQGSLVMWDGGVLHRQVGRETGTAYGKPAATPATLATRRNGVAYFAHCVRNGLAIDPPHDGATNIVVHEVVEAAYRASALGTRVSMHTAASEGTA